MRKTLSKLKKSIRRFPRAKNLYNFEKKQAKENQRIGYKKARFDRDLNSAIWFWIGFLAGGVMGFYYATLYFLAKYCG